MRYSDIEIGQTFLNRTSAHNGRTYLLCKTTKGLVENHPSYVRDYPHADVRKDDVYKTIRLK